MRIVISLQLFGFFSLSFLVFADTVAECSYKRHDEW